MNNTWAIFTERDVPTCSMLTGHGSPEEDSTRVVLPEMLNLPSALRQLLPSILFCGFSSSLFGWSFLVYRNLLSALPFFFPFHGNLMNQLSHLCFYWHLFLPVPFSHSKAGTPRFVSLLTSLEYFTVALLSVVIYLLISPGYLRANPLSLSLEYAAHNTDIDSCTWAAETECVSPKP